MDDGVFNLQIKNDKEQIISEIELTEDEEKIVD